MRDLASFVSPVVALGPIAATTDQTSGAVDLQGFGSAMVLVQAGIGGITFDGTNKLEFRLQHSETTTAGDFVDVVQADVNGLTLGSNGIIRALIAAHAAPSVTEASYVGNRRYLRVIADFSGTHGAATPFAVTIVRGHPEQQPA
jgi:hypothetical protein